MAVRRWLCGILGYNAQVGHYGLLVTDIFERIGFSIGEPLQVWVDGEWVDTYMDKDFVADEWFIPGTPYHGENIEYVRARVKAWLNPAHWNVENMEEWDN